MNNYVYHASKIQNLKSLKPSLSTHGKNWLYATTTLEMAAVFLSGKGGDLTCAVGRDNKSGKVYICERFKGAFEYRYDNSRASIYLLSKKEFIAGKTSWEEEVIAEQSVNVIKEIKIENVRNYILKLVEKNKILLVRYPKKIDNIPQDDEDLVYRGIIWVRQFGEMILKEFEKYHPHLIKRIKEGIKNGRYL